jgi:hypothetical protein
MTQAVREFSSAPKPLSLRHEPPPDPRARSRYFDRAEALEADGLQG